MTASGSIAQQLIDVLTAVTAVAVLAVLLPPFFQAQPPDSLSGVGLDGQSTEIDFTEGEQTLMMVLQSDCTFCHDSMPFYPRLLEHHRNEEARG